MALDIDSARKDMERWAQDLEVLRPFLQTTVDPLTIEKAWNATKMHFIQAVKAYTAAVEAMGGE
jgi:hypothetical protein